MRTSNQGKIQNTYTFFMSVVPKPIKTDPLDGMKND